MNYNIIIDPVSNKPHSIFSNKGLSLLKSFVRQYQKGGVRKAGDAKDIIYNFLNRNDLARLAATQKKALTPRMNNTLKIFKILDSVNNLEGEFLDETKEQNILDLINNPIGINWKYRSEVNYETEFGDKKKIINNCFTIFYIKNWC